MFGLFKSRKSPIQRRLESLLVVSRTWFEWSLLKDEWTETLVVETLYDINPTSPGFYSDGLEQIRLVMRAIASEDATPLPPIRLIPRKYG